jgi:zinc transport system substrate-binding protein
MKFEDNFLIKIYIIPCLLVFILLSSCSVQAKKEGLLLAVSIPPQAWFVSQIAGDKAAVLILAGPGQNPHNYEPTPKQIQGLASASAWILSGTEFEVSFRPKISALFPNLLVVDGSKGVKFRTLEEHDYDDEHDGSGRYALEIDRHTWLGREPAIILAAHIKDTLSFFDYENGAYYQEQYEKLVLEIDEEFDKLKIIMEPLRGKRVFVYHPSFGYFFDEFGIYQEAVETGGKEPGPRALYELILKLKEDRAAAVFVQTEFPVSAAKTLAAATGVELVSLDPLAWDWLENIRRMGDALKRDMP